MISVLDVEDLRIVYRTARGEAHAVDSVSFAIEPGEYLGLVGESGCGKSTIAKAILGILPENARVSGGAMRYKGENLVTLSRARLRQMRWTEIALVPQSAMNGFDPVTRSSSSSRKRSRRTVASPRGAAAPDRGALHPGRAGEAAPQRLPAPVLRRDAPARDDRDGDGARPGPRRRR